MRVLFVDDEIQVLEGIRRSLHRVRSDWQVDFVTSAEHALQKMDAEHVDVVVTDMRMTAMQGDQLIEKIHADHPSTVPIVLSGNMDQEILSSLEEWGIPMLAKPCATSTLVATIQETFQISIMSARSRKDDSPPTVFDGSVDIEQFLLLLAQGMILSGTLDATSLPPAVRTRLASNHDELNGVLEEQETMEVFSSRQDIIFYPAYEDIGGSSQHGSDGWTELIDDQQHD